MKKFFSVGKEGKVTMIIFIISQNIRYYPQYEPLQ